MKIDFLYSVKSNLKRIDLVRNNYRRIRRIVLHLLAGRFVRAFKLANHYNPLFWLIIRNRVYARWQQKKNLAKVLKRFYPNLVNQDNRKEVRIALIVRDGDTFPKSSSFIRLISPLTDTLVNKDIYLRLRSSKKPKIDEGTNICIIQRTAFDSLGAAKDFVNNTRRVKGSLIIDTDDAFSSINDTHPEFEIQSKRINAMEYLLKEADQIWLSEKALIPKKYSNKSKVVRNTLDNRLWKSGRQNKRKAYSQSSPIQMVYMGTATHDADFKMILPALDEVHLKYPGSFRLTTIGVSSEMPDRDWIRQLTTPRFGSLYPTFVRWFLRQGPFDIGLSPLVDSEFNRGKSDIKCLDYLAAGIMPVVSDILPYQNPELDDFIIRIKNNHNAWAEKLKEIVTNSKAFRQEKAQIIPKAQKYIWNKRSSTQAAAQIKRLLDELVSSKEAF